MIKFSNTGVKDFLKNYWQKKPLLIKQALPKFSAILSPEELAGLSLEEDFESRIIIGKGDKWSVKRGVFTSEDFAKLPESEWTLLVQGVDRYIDEVYKMMSLFSFIPRWRFDDVMISYATIGGSVGPHFDYYDVFLLQSSGKRNWKLSSQDCNMQNYLPNVPLRIMDKFTTEQTLDVETGDILYIPPQWAHHGESLSDDCTTMSFGYRSYKIDEMLDFVNKSENSQTAEKRENIYFKDPIWTHIDKPAYISDSINKSLEEQNIDMDLEEFGCFVTNLDLFDRKILQEEEFDIEDCFLDTEYQLPASCKIAYLFDKKDNLVVFINGEKFNIKNKDRKTMIDFCNNREKDKANI